MTSVSNNNNNFNLFPPVDNNNPDDQNVLETIAKTGAQVGQAVVDAGGKLVDNFEEDVAKVGNAAAEKGLGAAAAEAMDALSPGTFVTNGLDAAGIIDRDSALGQGISAAVNAGTNAFFLPAAAKDLMDMSKAGMSTPVVTTPAANRARGKKTRRGRKARRGRHTHGKGRCARAHEPRRSPRAQYHHCCQNGRIPRGYPKPVRGPGRSIEQILKLLNAAMLAKIIGNLFDSKVTVSDSKTDGTKQAGGSKKNEESYVSKLPKPATFEDYVMAFMMDVMVQQQKEILKKMEEIRANNKKIEAEMGKKNAKIMGNAVRGSINGMITATVSASPTLSAIAQAVEKLDSAQGKIEENKSDAELEKARNSRSMMMEELKNMQQKLQRMQQALSNVLNSFHQGAMNAIRNIK